MVESAEARGFELPQAREIETTSGKGVRAEVEGRSVAVGSPGFAFGEGQAKGADLVPARGKLEELQVAGNTVVAVTVDGESAALIALTDTATDDVRKTVERLGEAGDSGP